MNDPRRYYEMRRYVCPECLCQLRMEACQENEDRLVLVHDPTRSAVRPRPHSNSQCSRAGKRYYAPVLELTEYVDLPASADPRRPPFETFKGPTCRGSYILGSACGKCERCAWERSISGFALTHGVGQ